MSLGDDLAAALPELRAQAESAMLDECAVYEYTAGAWNDETGEESAGTTTTYYLGPCKVRMPDSASSKADSGEAQWTLNGATVSLPVDTSGDVRTGHELAMTASRFDAAIVGLEASVEGLHWQTFSTARRIKCTTESRDA